MTPTPRLLSVKEAAHRLNVSVGFVLDHAAGRRRPLLERVKMGRSVRISSDDLEKFIEECKKRVEGK